MFVEKFVSSKPVFNIHLLHHHQLPQSQVQPPRSPSQEQRDPPWPQRTLPPPCPPDVPVDEGSLGVHQVELVVQPGPGLGDGGGVGEHADSSGGLGQITSRNDSWWLVVDTNLESSGTPVNKLDAPLGLDGGDGGIDVLGDHVTPVEETAGHVLAM